MRATAMSFAFVAAIFLVSSAIAGPTISIHTDSGSYHGGDTVEVSLAGANDGDDASVDVYVGLWTATGGLFTLGDDGWAEGLTPWLTDLHVPSGFEMGRTPLCWLDLPCEMPPIGQQGEYSFAAGLTQPGTIEFISDISLAPFGVFQGFPTDFYVDAEFGDDGGLGTEGAPWCTITHALNSLQGSEMMPLIIHVAAGCYSAGSNGETFPLIMRSWISLRGEDRETTILDAGHSGYRVIHCNAVRELTIEGLTITGGEPSDASGGGIFCRNSPTNGSIKIINNRIIDNRADHGGGIYCEYASPLVRENMICDNSADFWMFSSGGAICCYDFSDPSIENNTISGNYSSYGGGIFCQYDSSPSILNNQIKENSADFAGAGLYCYDSPVVRGNMISSNSASRGAGIYCNGTAIIQGNCITKNLANGGYGGGVYCEKSDSSLISGNLISENDASMWGGSGAGISCCEWSSPSIIGNMILNNTAKYDGAGVYCDRNCEADIENNLIAGNDAADGGGIYCLYCEYHSPTISQNTITGNTASESGGGIRCASSGCSPAITDCIIWANSALEDMNLYGCSVLSFCCVENWDGSGDGNINADPMFVEGPFGDYYLDPNSPCIDAGSQTADEAGLSTRTTQADGMADTGQVDMGFHYRVP
ncbi:MAG: right-handed parallel beta-helix repeat-containing protein [Candidatus Coatesbacteria bacterium]|nr:right-handed parallel beta-helix repeat-containing protein [Candidatus Coatesbacteria bacterium]